MADPTSPKHKFIELGLFILSKTFLIFGCQFIISRQQRSSIVIIFFLKWSFPSVSNKISNLSISILVFFLAFMNESGQIKTLKIITRTVGSGMPITYIFFNKKTLLAYSKHFENLHKFYLQFCHIQVDVSILKATCNNVQCYRVHHTWYVTSWFF